MATKSTSTGIGSLFGQTMAPFISEASNKAKESKERVISTNQKTFILLGTFKMVKGMGSESGELFKAKNTLDIGLTT